LQARIRHPLLNDPDCIQSINQSAWRACLEVVPRKTSFPSKVDPSDNLARLNATRIFHMDDENELPAVAYLHIKKMFQLPSTASAALSTLHCT
jgi:hypothetical protein